MTCPNPWPCVRTTPHEGTDGRGCVHHGTTDDLGDHGHASDEGDLE